MMPRVLLVNPWAADFSAFDLWARPLGLLYLAGVARRLACEPILLDCADRHHESLNERPYRSRPFSCGKYPAEEITKPEILRWVPRRFKRYGISIEAFQRSLDRIGRPDLILVGSRMTHWYPGVVEAIRILRQRFAGAPIALGGVYPTLFPDHAERFSGADYFARGEGENVVVQLINDLLKPSSPAPPFDLDDLDCLPEPAYDLLSGRDCLPFLTSRGCPHRCSYCASRQMFARFRRRDPLRAADHLIECVERFGFCDVAFYDDALLADAPRHFIPFCDRLIAECRRLGSELRFHTPNGLDYAVLDEAAAERMANLGFETIRLSLETANRERLRQLGRESDLSRFETALQALARAGFDLRRVGVYVLFGLPGQNRHEVEQNVDYVLSLGATPKLSEYSPLPFTAEWEKVRKLGNPPLEEEPLLTNNSVFYRLGAEFPDSWVNDLRHRIRETRPTSTSQ
jgi:radical SAM superfamily enzyme YgiQ (UPF0313 family)